MVEALVITTDWIELLPKCEDDDIIESYSIPSVKNVTWVRVYPDPTLDPEGSGLGLEILYLEGMGPVLGPSFTIRYYNKITHGRKNKLWTLDCVFINLTQIDVSRNILTKSKLPTIPVRTVGLYFVNIILARSQKAGVETNEVISPVNDKLLSSIKVRPSSLDMPGQVYSPSQFGQLKVNHFLYRTRRPASEMRITSRGADPMRDTSINAG
ncbi:hypothetical protein M9H77_13944 [Catharanthus roseus]|uniref:Uncharacterized protein n=1 Tax=Catharanthus roseus TaxID=4058 RepID=A0ACC0BLL7_CATRO|nr:hypothetical protein M9H77_13944 [Catharanthus roseus]